MKAKEMSGVKGWSRALLCAGLLGLGLSACVPPPTKPGKPAAYRVNPAIAQASALAQNHASMSGQARIDAAREIERLLAGIDTATLAVEAGRMGEGDPLYNFAGRELMRLC